MSFFKHLVESCSETIWVCRVWGEFLNDKFYFLNSNVVIELFFILGGLWWLVFLRN